MAEDSTYDFASRDYTTIRNDLLTRASRTMPDWVDRDPADFGIALVDLWSYMGDILHYYIDRAASEAFINTATQRESVLALANLFDYTPRFRSPAKGTVYITNTSSASAVVPANTRFTGVYNDTLYHFYSTDNVAILAGSTIGVPVSEGKIVSNEILTNSSNGAIGQRYALSETTAVATGISVYVAEDGITPTLWNQTANVNTLPINAAGYSVYNSASGKLEIVFGNRLGGRIPPVGSKITATYATCSGAAGNLPANKINTFYGGSPSAGLIIANSSALSFGSDVESVESIKTSLKATVQTQDRAVTLQDFVNYTLLVTGVFRAVASYNASTKKVTIYAMPFIADYTTSSASAASVPASVKSEIETTLSDKTLLGVTVEVASSVTFNSVNIGGSIHVNDQYVQSQVERAVTNALTGLFEQYNLDFGKEIKLAEVYRTMMLVEGVDYVDNVTVTMKTPTNVTIPAGTLSPTEFLRKGTFTLTSFGGITTSG